METNNYDPWWDGKIGISFTRSEWSLIKHELEQLYLIPDFPERETDKILEEIMVTINKNIGV